MARVQPPRDALDELEMELAVEIQLVAAEA
jgi:hypothetical protein